MAVGQEVSLHELRNQLTEQVNAGFQKLTSKDKKLIKKHFKPTHLMRWDEDGIPQSYTDPKCASLYKFQTVRNPELKKLYNKLLTLGIGMGGGDSIMIQVFDRV